MVCQAKQQAATNRARSLEAQIKRFAKGHQRRLRKLVKTTSRLGDILYSFPGAAFALVSGHADHNRRGEAVRLIKDGQSLKHVARVLDLPWWIRRLPPEAFAGSLDMLPDGEGFNHKVGNLIPRKDQVAAMWLNWLQAGNQASTEDFALWLASQKVYNHAHRFVGAVEVDAPVVPLAVYAWFSSLDDGHRARRMIEHPWHPKMPFEAAVRNMCGWFDRVLLDLTRGDKNRGPGRYSARKRRRGYTLVPLRTAADLHEEGAAMDHCVGSYVSAVAQGHSAIYSVRSGPRRIATLEIGRMSARDDRLEVRQLLGHSNQAVDRDVYQAVVEWLDEQASLPMFGRNMLGRLAFGPEVHGQMHAHLALDETRWRAFWGCYIEEKSGLLIDPERPSGQLLYKLSRDVDLLSRYAHGC